MKKYLFILCSAAIMAACQKSETAAPVENGTATGGDVIVTFAGGALSKVSVGDKVGDSYQGLWTSGDAIAVYKTDGTSIGNASLQSGAGEHSGTFALATDPSLADGTAVRVVYPASSSYSGENSIASEQNAGKDLAGRTFAFSEALVTSSTSVVGFSLYHAAALVKVVVSSSEYEGASVDHIIFRCEGAALSGTFTTNLETKEVTPADTKDYVKVNTSITLGSSAQEIWFTAIPSDLSGKELDIAFHITKDGNSFYLPVGFKGKELKANTVNSFGISSLKESDCVSWYEPFDTRVMDCPTYAYGDANTFFIQCKNGSTYTGATYAANADIPNSVEISIKARGEFLKVHNPVGATFEWAKKGSTSTIYTMRTSGYSASGVDPTKYSFSYDGKTTVTVTNTGAFAGSPILLMKKDGKVLWSWTFWNIAADGTKVESIDFGGYKLANMDIGQATLDGATWAANLNGSNPDLLYRTVNRYQFGRHMPIFFETYWSIHNEDNSETGNVPVVYGPVTIDEAISNPVGVVANQTIDTDLKPWCSDMKANIWGGLAKAEDGQKAVMDPCPKGWRVADKNALEAMRTQTITTQAGAGYQGLCSNGNLFMRAGTCTAKTTNNSSGIHVVGTEGGAANGTSGVGKWWSCYVAGASSTSTYCLTASTTAFGISNYLLFAYSCSVRCQVDEDNR